MHSHSFVNIRHAFSAHELPNDNFLTIKSCITNIFCYLIFHQRHLDLRCYCPDRNLNWNFDWSPNYAFVYKKVGTDLLIN